MTQTQAAPKKTVSEMPKWKLIGPVYLADHLYYNQQAIDNAPEGGIIVEFDGPPNAHMVPVNDAAQRLYDERPPVFTDPLDVIAPFTTARK